MNQPSSTADILGLRTYSKYDPRQLLAYVPGTEAHVERRVTQLFNEDSFDPEALTTYEAGVLNDSVRDKYKPALIQSERSRVLGAVVGAVAPYEFLLIGAVVLAASASSTTGAWYSITLKEMKAKFEGMGLSLTSRLLRSDMNANALSMYAGIGFAHRMIAYPAVMEFVNDPNEVTFAKALTFVLVSGVLHHKIGGVLRDKENASIQFDYNDATLAGMTEEQQKFFADAISDVRKELDSVRNLGPGVNYNHTISRCVKAMTSMVQGCDVHQVHQSVFEKIDGMGSDIDTNYESDLKPFADYFHSVITQLIDLLSLEDDVNSKLKEQLEKLNSSTGEEGMHQRLSAIAADVIPVLTKFLQENGEKGIVEGVSQT